MVKFLDVVERYTDMRLEHHNWRKGQCLFNALYELAPKLADSIRGGFLDPFHHDKRFHACMSWIAQNTVQE